MTGQIGGARIVFTPAANALPLHRAHGGRFNRDFWVEDGQYFALAVDNEGKQVDALTSNNGHLLWSGIVDKAKAVAAHLLGPRLSGWGVCTLAEGEGRYNPIGYHVGTVWPFDTSFIAWGLVPTRPQRDHVGEGEGYPRTSRASRARACAREEVGAFAAGPAGNQAPTVIVWPRGVGTRSRVCACAREEVVGVLRRGGIPPVPPRTTERRGALPHSYCSATQPLSVFCLCGQPAGHQGSRLLHRLRPAL